ncbi:MAG: hypothetical protein IJN75_06355 [Clostridia bacterium]|nr:hypothetical protein [Clostridia bacterium]
MTVSELITKADLEIVNLADAEREIVGGYTGDLLSFVMGNVETDNVWVTIMTNTNIVAVASLADVGCIVITEAEELPNETVESAKLRNINILKTKRNSYEMCAILAGFGI